MFFMPSQPVRLYEGQGRVIDVLYNKKRAVIQIQENGWVDRDQLQEWS